MKQNDRDAKAAAHADAINEVVRLMEAMQMPGVWQIVGFSRETARKWAFPTEPCRVIKFPRKTRKSGPARTISDDSSRSVPNTTEVKFYANGEVSWMYWVPFPIPAKI